MTVNFDKSYQHYGGLYINRYVLKDGFTAWYMYKTGTRVRETIKKRADESCGSLFPECFDESRKRCDERYFSSVRTDFQAPLNSIVYEPIKCK